MTEGTYNDQGNSGYPRLEDQIEWYDRKSNSAQSMYKFFKYIEFGVTALVPVVAPLNGFAAAVLGGISLTFEMLQHINQWQHNWITYRSTCESLRHEKYTFIGKAGVYVGLDEKDAFRVLVERTEALISTEHAKWISRQEFDSTPDKSRRRQVRKL